MHLSEKIIADHRHLYCFYPQLLLRDPEDKRKDIDAEPIISEKSQNKEQKTSGEFILCKACGHMITTRNDTINVRNSHRHTFANPAGIIFDIGCFKSAPGCLRTGPFTDEFSWFKGFKWRISICESCFTHLGWFFLSANSNFFGLILERLIDAGSHR